MTFARLWSSLLHVFANTGLNLACLVEEALNHPYLLSLHEINEEPICLSPFVFDFEQTSLDEDDIKELIWSESLKFNPEDVLVEWLFIQILILRYEKSSIVLCLVLYFCKYFNSMMELRICGFRVGSSDSQYSSTYKILSPTDNYLLQVTGFILMINQWCWIMFVDCFEKILHPRCTVVSCYVGEWMILCSLTVRNA